MSEPDTQAPEVPPAPPEADETLAAEVEHVVEIPLAHLKAILERAEFDVIGKAHATWEDLKALVDQAEAKLKEIV